MPDVDVLTVGAGPTGLFAAYDAGFRGLSVAVTDSLPEVGGQVAATYPEKLLYDVAGSPAVRGRDDRYVEVATAVNDAAVEIDPQAKLFPGHSTGRAEAG